MTGPNRPSPIEPRTGRVVAAHGRDAVVRDEERGHVRCRLATRRLTIICGDRVHWTEAATEGGAGLIVAVLPRRTALARLNRRGAAEPFAANLTQLVVVLAPRPEPDFGICDRYLAAAEWAGLEACIAINKSDLPEAPALLATVGRTYAAAAVPVVAATCRRDGGTAALAARLAGATSMLVGQSGVGKSSLANQLVPGTAAAVGEISLSAGGRHTTSAAMLYELPGAGALIDAPGVRDFAPPLPEPRALARGFREIAAAADRCRFADCRHRQEPGCAVVAAVAAGEIAARRLASYRELLALAEHLARPGPPRLRR